MEQSYFLLKKSKVRSVHFLHIHQYSTFPLVFHFLSSLSPSLSLSFSLSLHPPPSLSLSPAFCLSLTPLSLYAPSMNTECNYRNDWIKKKTVTYAKISPKMVNPRDPSGEHRIRRKPSHASLEVDTFPQGHCSPRVETTMLTPRVSDWLGEPPTCIWPHPLDWLLWVQACH